MLRKEVAELFSLCMQVTTETSSFVSFRINSNVKACYISIIDKGYEPNVRNDGYYAVYFDNELFKEDSGKDYEAAKEHLNRLLKENGS